eukprot:scaffold107740_cov30-Tisochrysis_lutea.AAC.1
MVYIINTQRTAEEDRKALLALPLQKDHSARNLEVHPGLADFQARFWKVGTTDLTVKVSDADQDLEGAAQKGNEM